MKLKLVGYSERDISKKNISVTRDEVFEIDEETGLSLLSQNTEQFQIWKKVEDKKIKSDPTLLQDKELAS